MNLFILKSYELIGNKAYQDSDTATSSLKIRIVGEGVVPIDNSTYNKTRLNKNDPHYYQKLFYFDHGIEYKMIDPADYIVP